MWLLDHNIPLITVDLLRARGVSCETAKHFGWDRKRNGELVLAAANQSFTAVLTRDILFIESAAKTLKKFPDFGIVLIKLPQLREKLFVQAFEQAWSALPIVPEMGRLSNGRELPIEDAVSHKLAESPSTSPNLVDRQRITTSDMRFPGLLISTRT